jgi:hypothetical protein
LKVRVPIVRAAPQAIYAWQSPSPIRYPPSQMYDEVTIEAEYDAQHDWVRVVVTETDGDTGTKTRLLTVFTYKTLKDSQDPGGLIHGTVTRAGGPRAASPLHYDQALSYLGRQAPTTRTGGLRTGGMVATTAATASMNFQTTVTTHKMQAFMYGAMGIDYDPCPHEKLKWRAVDSRIEVGECEACGKVRKATEIGR